MTSIDLELRLQADKFGLIQPYGYYDLNAALTPVAAPKASTGLTGVRLSIPVTAPPSS